MGDEDSDDVSRTLFDLEAEVGRLARVDPETLRPGIVTVRSPHEIRTRLVS
jgi:hypothetical protein